MAGRMGKVFNLGKKEKPETTRIGLIVSKNLHTKFKKYALNENKTMTEILTEILQEYLGMNEDKT